jgi:hypothetical protein
MTIRGRYNICKISFSIQQYFALGADVQFEYTGENALTVGGSVTGKRYRFIQSGNVQSVDYRDVPSMMTIPVLKKIA